MKSMEEGTLGEDSVPNTFEKSHLLQFVIIKAVLMKIQAF
jgi:hypothetical protein